jgi:hypothetical protein
MVTTVGNDFGDGIRRRVGVIGPAGVADPTPAGPLSELPVSVACWSVVTSTSPVRHPLETFAWHAWPAAGLPGM